MFSLAFYAMVAHAVPRVTEIGPAVRLGVEGRHARPFVGPAGRTWIGFGRSGSFWAIPLDGAMLPIHHEERVVIRGDGRFVDHMMVPCDDGTWLHVASGRTRRHDDST